MDLKLTTLDDTADLTFNQLLGINNDGRIAGYFGSGAPGHPNKGYTITPNYDQDDFHNENFPGSVQTQVTGLNDWGVTVGFEANANGNNVGFIEYAGRFEKVSDPNAAPAATSPTGTPSVQQLLGINDHEVAVGFYTDANNVNHGFEFNALDGQFTAVSVQDFTNITATGINNEGDISGFGTVNGKTEGFVEDPRGHVTALAGPNGATSVQALGLNDRGEVVGDYTDAQGNTHGFLYDMHSKSYTTIDAGNDTMTVINGLNDRNELVGFYVDAKGNTNGLLVQVGDHHH